MASGNAGINTLIGFAKGPGLAAGKPAPKPAAKGPGSALLGLAGNLTKQPAAPAVSGYFNAQGTPTFYNAVTQPQTQQAIQSSLQAQQPAAGASAQPTGAASAAGSPLDSTYYNQVADYLNKTGNSIAADQAKIGNYDTSLQTTLGNLAYQQPRDALALMQKANANGGLFSSVYGQNQGNLQHAYAEKQTAAQQSHDQNVNALTTEIGQLQASEDPNSPTMLGYALASGQRAATAAGNNPALGQNAPAAPAPAAAATSSTAKPATKGKATGVGSALLNLAKNLERGKK